MALVSSQGPLTSPLRFTLELAFWLHDQLDQPAASISSSSFLLSPSFLSFFSPAIRRDCLRASWSKFFCLVHSVETVYLVVIFPTTNPTRRKSATIPVLLRNLLLYPPTVHLALKFPTQICASCYYCDYVSIILTS